MISKISYNLGTSNANNLKKTDKTNFCQKKVKVLLTPEEVAKKFSNALAGEDLDTVVGRIHLLKSFSDAEPNMTLEQFVKALKGELIISSR